MQKKILVLTGSPRKGGNSDQLADAFIKGAQSSGHIVAKFATGDKNIKGCRACKTCFTKGLACSFDDDFNELAPLIEEAEVIVFATPVYCFSFTTQIKAAIDKFYSFMVGQRNLKLKECVLLSCAADNSTEVFEGLISSYKLMTGYLRCKNSGILAVPGVFEKDSIQQTDGLRNAEELGKNI